MTTTNSSSRAPFAAALRAAIDERGLALGRIVARLDQAGTPLSVATLSYWQSGRSQPGRQTSMECLSVLEQILRVEPGHLVGQLGRPAARGRHQEPPTWIQLWDGVPEVVSAFQRMDTSHEDYLTRVSYHDRIVIGPDGTERSAWTRQLMRCERDGADRFILMHGTDESSGALSELRALDRCTVGRSTSVPGSGVVTSEMLLPRPLHRGEFIAVEYEYVESPPYPPSHRYERRRRSANRQYVLEVRFDPAAQPVRCERYTQPVEGERTVETLSWDPRDGLLLVELDGRPGIVGARWEWPADFHDARREHNEL